MEANELRIGNYLEMLGKVRKIQCISNLPSRKEMYWLTCENMIDTKIIHFKPIQLTEEWLLKFGAKELKPKRGVLKELVLKKVRIEMSNSGNFYYKNSKLILESVHQLQNLYFALTGEELTVNI